MPSFQFHLGSRVSLPSAAAGCVLIFLALIWPGDSLGSGGQTMERPLTLAVLDFGDSGIGRVAPDKVALNLKHETGVVILDRDQVRAAARGVGYSGSINLALNEARDLGAALGCDFFVLGDAQTLRRSPSAGPV